MVWTHPSLKKNTLFCHQTESKNSLTSGGGRTNQFGTGEIHKAGSIKIKRKDKKTGEIRYLAKDHNKRECWEQQSLTVTRQTKETSLTMEEVCKEFASLCP